MEGKTFSIGQALSVGWKATTERIWYWIGVLIVGGIIAVLPAVLSSFLNEREASIGSVFALIGYVLQIGIAIGVLRISLMTVDGKKPTFGELFSGFKDAKTFGRYVLAAILVGLMVMVGLILLVVPGVVASMKYGFYGYAVVDKNVTAMQAIKISGLATKGNMWNIFLFVLIACGLAMLGMIPLGLGLFLVLPTLTIAQAYIYRQLSAGVQVPTAPAMPAAPRV